MNNSNSTTGSVGPSGTSNHRSAASGDVSFDSGSSLSSGHDDRTVNSNVSSDGVALHEGLVNAGSEDARIERALSDDALSTIADDDTIMNDSNELLEFDFDSEVPPLSWSQQASMARDIKLLQKRLFEATRLSLTMPGDSTLASNAGALKRQLLMAKENY